MSMNVRQNAIGLLTTPNKHSPLAVHNAIIDLRRNPKAGDEHLLRKYLDYPDDMVVSAVLYALIHIYESVPDLKELLLRFADGDDRDNGEMPIQTQAIEGLASYSREDASALSKLLEVASKSDTAEAPRARAWKCIAELFGVPWQREYSDAMIWDPESEKSISIRKEVLSAVEARDGKPLIV
jgi:hypothetical protein